MPAGVVGQAWRDGRVRVALGRSLRSLEVEIVLLDDQLARSCGELCAASNSLDVIDASVVIVAKERRDPIVTSDTNDLQRCFSPGYSCWKYRGILPPETNRLRILPSYALNQWDAAVSGQVGHFHFLQCRAQGAKVSLGYATRLYVKNPGTVLLTAAICYAQAR